MRQLNGVGYLEENMLTRNPAKMQLLFGNQMTRSLAKKMAGWKLMRLIFGKQLDKNAAAMKLMRLIFGKQITYSLAAIARLGVADYMDTTPVHIKQLAARVGAHAPSLFRVMRLLAGVGVF